MNTKIVIRRIGVLSVAKIMGTLYAILGLIIGACISLFSVLGSALLSSSGISSNFGMIFGVGSIILFPIVYGLLGFIGGLITAALYNLLAGVVGGVEIEGAQTQA